MTAHLASSEVAHDSPLDHAHDSQELPAVGHGKVDSNLVQALAQEMMRLVKGQQGTGVQHNDTGAFAHFAGISSHSPISCAVLNGAQGSWIIDTGASDHMTFDFILFSNTSTLPFPVHVTLPDGSIKPVTLVDDIQLSPSLNLRNVLFVPDFKYSLLSVAKFLTDNYCCTVFYPTHRVFQDLSTKLIVAVGKKAGGLYTFDSSHLKAKALTSDVSATSSNSANQKKPSLCSLSQLSM